MRHFNRLVLAACFAFTLSFIPGCGGSTEATVTEPAPETVVSDADIAKQQKVREEQEKNYDPQNSDGLEPDTGTGGSPAGI